METTTTRNATEFIGVDTSGPGSIGSVNHNSPDPDAATHEYGFDLTDFGSAREFLAVLEENDLDYDGSYSHVELRPASDDRSAYMLFVWANEDVMLVTGNNPLTGEYRDPEMRPPEKGFASYMGIEGEPDAVRALASSIRDHATFIKGADDSARQFI